MKNKTLSQKLLLMLFVVALSAQTQVIEKQQGLVEDKQLLRAGQENRDTSSTINYNKTFYVSVGLGTVELTNLNFGIRVYDGFYATTNLGVTLVRSNKGFVGFLGSRFYKVGVTWRPSSDESTLFGSVEIGKAKLDVEESTPTLYVPNQADLASLLVGYEWRYDSGFNLGLRVGIKYSKREREEDRFAFGFQFTLGWFF